MHMQMSVIVRRKKINITRSEQEVDDLFRTSASHATVRQLYLLFESLRAKGGAKPQYL